MQTEAKGGRAQGALPQRGPMSVGGEGGDGTEILNKL